MSMCNVYTYYKNTTAVYCYCWYLFIYESIAFYLLLSTRSSWTWPHWHWHPQYNNRKVIRNPHPREVWSAPRAAVCAIHIHIHTTALAAHPTTTSTQHDKSQITSSDHSVRRVRLSRSSLALRVTRFPVPSIFHHPRCCKLEGRAPN